MLEAISRWKKVKEELETEDAAVGKGERKEERGVAAELEQAMGLLSDVAVLCESIEQYSSSVDSKDDHRDGVRGHAASEQDPAPTVET